MTCRSIPKAIALAVACLLPTACTVSENDSARVDCGVPGAHGVDCVVQRTAGSRAFEACWDLAITCANGGVMTGSACHSMAAEADKGEQNMPAAGFSNQASCDAPASGKVEQLKSTSH